uniref:Uncharacterized protein n=1 Tax=Anguilla anguilla TaxID=7936 RepID=A0A0E9XFI7_ANGAN
MDDYECLFVLILIEHRVTYPLANSLFLYIDYFICHLFYINLTYKIWH